MAGSSRTEVAVEGRGHPGLAPKTQAQAGPIIIRRTDDRIAEAFAMRATMGGSYQAMGE
jgi:hypothetical protein